jgi:hypothetical protein
MKKVWLLVLLYLFISGIFVTTFNPVIASKIVEDSWKTKSSMNQARTDLGVVAVDGKIYAIGGYTRNNSRVEDVVGTNERYDPRSDTWVSLESMPTPRGGFGIAAYDGKIYCIGGTIRNYTLVTLGTHPFQPCAVNEVYDIAADSWSTKASPPINLHGQTHVINGNFFFITNNLLHTYDPVTDSWTEKAFTPSDSDMFVIVSAVVDNKIMIGFSSRMHNVQKVMFYEPVTDVWSGGVSSLSMFTGVTGVTSGNYAPQKIYVLGFADVPHSNISLTNQIYDPSSDAWSIGKAIPTYRHAFDVAVVDDVLYLTF